MEKKKQVKPLTREDFRTRGKLTLFLHYFKPHRKLFILDICCAFLIGLIDLAFPLVSRSALYHLLPEQKYGPFFVLMASVVGFYILRSILNYIVTYWGHTFGIRVEADIRRDLFRQMQTLGFDFYDENRTGQLMSRLTAELFDLTELAHHGPEDVLISFVTIVGALVVMFTIEWRLALVMAVMIPLFLAIAMAQRKALMNAARQVKQKTAHINTEIETSLSGIRVAKAFAREDVEMERFDRANGEFRCSKGAQYKAMGRFISWLEFFLCSLNVAVIAFGGYLIMKGRMNAVDLLTFTLYTGTFINPLRKLANFSELFVSGFAGLQRFTELMGREPTQQDAPNAETLGDVEGEIDVDHVSFAYEGDLAVLHDVSVHIRPGETVAVVGPSGGGKSTLCQLLPRFYDVTSGEIRVDGKDIRGLTMHSLRENIGIVQQDVFLFADTILENIRYGRPDATEVEVIEAAKKAEIYEDILAMPQGLNTYVGERGTLLSGGQKQRISIARIFLKNPPILILDEATSALDSVTEAKIQRAFDQLAEGRTTLIIAHRLSTIRAAERILVVADGRIQEEGTHEALLQKGGLYAQLYTTQRNIASHA